MEAAETPKPDAPSPPEPPQAQVRARFLVAPDRILVDALLCLDASGRIAAIEVPADGPGGRDGDDFVAPGLIDLQVNGFAGEDLHRCDADGFERLGRALLGRGVTGYLPTLISAPAAELCRRLELLASWLGEREDAATPLGIHLEGPFLNPERRGAHPREALVRPDPVLFDELCAAAGPVLKLLTLAPELDGALDLCATAVARGLVVSLGHSAAGPDEVAAAVAHGAGLVTHLGNAMPPLAARAPGLCGAALVEPALRVGLIADGVHVAPALLRLAHAAKPPGGLYLVSDAISGAGLGDGDRQLGGLGIRVEGGVARDAAGRLAGSTTDLFAAAGHFSAVLACSPVPAFVAASTVPASILGLDDRGALRPGLRADLLRFDRRPEGWQLREVRRGRRCFQPR